MKKIILISGIGFSSFMLFAGIMITFVQNAGNAPKPTDLALIAIFALLDLFCIWKLVKNNKKEKTVSQQTQIKQSAHINTQQRYVSPSAEQNSQNMQHDQPLNSQTQMFFSLEIENDIRIMDESYAIATRTLNLDTFKMRYDLYLQKAHMILERTTNPQLIKHCRSLIADRDRIKSRIALDFVKKALDDTKQLKTTNGIISRLESSYSQLQNAVFLHDVPEYSTSISLLQETINNIKAIDSANIQVTAEHTPPKEDSTYSSFTPNYNKSIEEISEDARKHSDAMNQHHMSAIRGFDPFSLDPSIVDDEPFTSVEKAFLKYMNGNRVKNPYIPGYWTYEYNINYKKLLTTFLVKGYLRISSEYDMLPYLKMEALKDILRNYGLKTSGKKEELIARIRNDVSAEAIKSIIPDSEQKYILTEQGKCLTDTVKDSATKNPDLEDTCLQLIAESKFNDAYVEVCKNEQNKNIPRGIVNWNHELNSGLSQVQIDCFRNFMSASELVFPPVISPDQYINAKSCIILGIMLGVSIEKIYKMFCRVSDKTYNRSIVIPFLQNLQFELMDSILKMESNCF